jgi:hypothetical protein
MLSAAQYPEKAYGMQLLCWQQLRWPATRLVFFAFALFDDAEFMPVRVLQFVQIVLARHDDFCLHNEVGQYHGAGFNGRVHIPFV